MATSVFNRTPVRPGTCAEAARGGARAQLLEIGFTPSAIRHRLRVGPACAPPGRLRDRQARDRPIGALDGRRPVLRPRGAPRSSQCCRAVGLGAFPVGPIEIVVPAGLARRCPAQSAPTCGSGSIAPACSRGSRSPTSSRPDQPGDRPGRGRGQSERDRFRPTRRRLIPAPAFFAGGRRTPRRAPDGPGPGRILDPPTASRPPNPPSTAPFCP